MLYLYVNVKKGGFKYDRNGLYWFLIDADYLHSTLKGTENHTTMADEQELLEFDY